MVNSELLSLKLTIPPKGEKTIIYLAFVGGKETKRKRDKETKNKV